MNVLERLQPITTFVFDVDGVLTDGKLLVLPGGVFARSMNVKDGYALQLAVKRGYKLIIISGGTSDEVKERLNRLGITHVYMQVTDKISVLKQVLEQENINWSEVLYMGDDVPDLVVMQRSAVACCPSDAVSEIKELSHYISPLPGGAGCVRDIIEKVMRSRGHWNDDTHIPSQ